MNEPSTGDPWIDAYLRFRQAWLDCATETELTDLATECRRDLPSPTPPIPAAMFIHRDIVIIAGQKAVSPPLVTCEYKNTPSDSSARSRQFPPGGNGQ